MQLQNRQKKQKQNFCENNMISAQPIRKDQTQEHLQMNPINIVFKNISYSVQIKSQEERYVLLCNRNKQTKQILKDLTGLVKAGEVTAILGASGAGKTTLLNILACRVEHNSKGTLYANKHPYNYDSFGDFANYVMQSDVLLQTLTVRQTLQFAADLKLNISNQEKYNRIADLAKNMKLQNCLDVKVGGQLIKGISGGEKKRTSIAFQLISDPQVIMLDQPTLDLDSLTSFIIQFSSLKRQNCLMTIHQPNIDIYRKFDRLFLMTEGRFVYQGPSTQALDYFQNNFGLVCGSFVNPAEFQLHIVHPQNHRNYFKMFDQKLYPSIMTQIQNLEDIQIIKRENKVSTISTFCTLARRDYINIFENPLLVKRRIFQSILLGLFIGGVYFQAGKDKYINQADWYTIVGFFFFMSIGAMMTALTTVTLIFPTERPVFLKQQNARFYSVLPYFLSRNCIQIPYLIIMPFILKVIIYWMVGLSATAEQFFMLYFTIFLVNLIFDKRSLGN